MTLLRDQSTINRIWIVLSFCFLIASTSLAQNGAVSGTVRDAEGGTTLPGANVFLKDNPTNGTVTDIDGDFRLAGVPVGSQTIIISFLGYETVERTVDVRSDQVATFEVSLEAVSLTGSEVIVTAQLLGQAKSINQQLNSESIVNIISADRIQELPDVNAAEAIARLPGVAINRNGGEGQKVVIRGLEPKFAQITVNGVSLPSNSSSDRSVDLSLIAPELLDGIEVYKSPLPDMDAEAIGGTVNLRLRRAPEGLRLTAKGLGGFNELNDDFRDYKGVLQLSQRFFNNRLGLVAQGGIERFNRGGDFLTNRWFQGPTNDSTGVTEILGNNLTLEERQEIRRRWNSSLGLDYSMGKSTFSLFGLYSRTERDRFNQQEIYTPANPTIDYIGRTIDNNLDLYSISLTGEHSLNSVIIDWTISSSESRGETPYNFNMAFQDSRQAFEPGLDATGNPRTFLDAARPDLERTLLRSASMTMSETNEQTNTALLNFRFPFRISEGLGGYLKVGGKYKEIDRNRQVDEFAEDFYYLGAQFTDEAAARYNGDLVFFPGNPELISILSFIDPENTIEFEDENGNSFDFATSLDEQLIRDWYDAQAPILNNDRSAIVDNYDVLERVTAGYVMLKLNIGKNLSVIPGFRYEYSDNTYSSGLSTINGRYGVNGFFFDSTSLVQYGEFLPHLHLKYQITDWLDVRASAAKTLARPDFLFITPRIQVDNGNTRITAGNPNLQHAEAMNYDLSFSAYKGGLGLLTFGAFYKDIQNIFYPWRTNLFDQETADFFGFPNNRGYEYRSFLNSEDSEVYGFEVDLQTNLSFLPGLLSGFVINANYARLYSATNVFFLTSETRLIQPVPPIFETTFETQTREVDLQSQAPSILRLSLGYDYKKFSARVSGSFQGTKARGYSINKDFDTFDLEFWRWDASFKQRFGNNWSFFLNLNNFNNQQDISFTRNQSFLNTVETYGFTGTFGLQYQL